ncbi:MAG: glycosyltransferase [Culicoidibacterales bacterium]
MWKEKCIRVICSRETNINNIKIGIIANSLSMGGAERVSVILAETLTKMNKNIELITIAKSKTDSYQVSESVPLVQLNPYGEFSKLVIMKKLRQHIKNSQLDVVLVMGTPLMPIVILALLGTKTKVVVSERNDPNNFHGKKTTKIISNLLKNYAAGYVFQTQGARTAFGLTRKKVSTVIYNPISVNNIPTRDNSIQRKKEIISVGRLVKQKNQELLIRSFSEVVEIFSEYQLIIYGEGPLRDYLQQIIDDLDMSGNILLAGNKADIFDKMQSAELFVFPSDFEGMPNALIEAMCMGLPVISTDCSPGGAREVIKDKENGILVKVNDKKQMIDAMIYMLEHKNKAEQMAKEAMKIRPNFDSNKIAESFFLFLSEVATNNRKGV